MGLIEIDGTNAQRGCDHQPDVGEPYKGRKRRMHSCVFCRLAGLLEQTKGNNCCDACSQDYPVSSLREATDREEGPNDSEQKSVTKRPLLQGFEAEKNRQPARAKSPHNWNKERIGDQSQEPCLEDQWKCRSGLVQTHVSGNHQVHQQGDAKAGRADQHRKDPDRHSVIVLTRTSWTMASDGEKKNEEAAKLQHR